MTDTFGEGDDTSEINYDRVADMFEDFCERLQNENVFDVIVAFEKTIAQILITHCVSHQAASKVIDTMEHNIRGMLDHMDSIGMAAWHEPSQRN